MNIDKPISNKEVPKRKEGGGSKKEYDVLVKKILSLAKGNSLPIICVDKAESLRIYNAIRRRSKDIVIVFRGLTIYASNDEID